MSNQNPSTVLLDDGNTYNVVHVFTPARLVIDFGGGAFVIVDQVPNTTTFTLTGTPARPDEEQVIKALNAPFNDTTVTTVTKDE